MTQNALLFNYQYCSGCHSCELACRNERGLGLGIWGIKVAEIKPFEIDEENFEWIYQPIPTKLCDLCVDRVEKGSSPACVHHCLAFCIEYGTIDDMQKRAKEIGERVSIFLP